jgi:hypothetical protein
MSATGNDVAEVGSPADRFHSAANAVLSTLRPLLHEDWSAQAGTLDWTCWQTLDHMVDCVFSYALQLASRAPQGFPPLGELHGLPEAQAGDLLVALTGITELFGTFLRFVPTDVEASDGVVALKPDDWAARAAYELLIHTHDIATGLGTSFFPPLAIASWVVDSPNLWMLDRTAASPGGDAWESLLMCSGR